MFEYSVQPTWRLKMEIITAVTAWALSSACKSIPAGHWLASVCPRGGNLTELSGRLSSDAHVYYPGSDVFIEATNRWSSFHAPGVNVVVVPGVDDDIIQTVKYANENDMPYLAVTGGHGAIITTGRMQNGIEIWMDQLSGVEVAEDGTSAKIKGGTLSKTVTETLWAAGKQTVTGGCECTSLLGPGLGGGHGFLQGRHGLISDQFLSMDIVLANGSLVTIDDNSDLWWAMQGAGHNFGIVTSVTSKIYDIEHRDWAYESFVFTSDKVEGLYGNINAYLLNNGSPPVDIINYGFFLNNPAIDSKPVTYFYILQEGATVVDLTYTKPFHDLGPAEAGAGSGSYLDLPAWTGLNNEAAPCQHTGLANTRFPLDIQVYDVPAMRRVYDEFAAATQATPALNGSFFLIEGYSLQGVRAVASESAAFPFRGDPLLVAPVISWAPAGPELARQAAALGTRLRRILHEASGRAEMHTYVNYAFGDETPENWYGYETWRQERLRQLKDKYDPERKFSFYAPIA